MTRITIGIASYNQAEYLEDAIESAYNQTIPAHEIIICNDGSTDNSLEISERYMFRQLPGLESPVRVINQVNKGLSSARNSIIMSATGDYIWFLDSDDMLKENAIEKMLQNMAATNFSADVYAPSFETFGLKNNQVIIGGFTMEDLKLANRLGYFSCIRRSALLETGGYSPKMRWGYEDYHEWFDLFSRNKLLAPIKDVLVRYRIKENSMIIEANKHSDELMGQIKHDFPHIFP